MAALVYSGYLCKPKTQLPKVLASFTLHHSSCSLQHCLVAERCPVGPVFIVYKQERKLKSQSRTLLNSSESEDTDSGGEDGYEAQAMQPPVYLFSSALLGEPKQAYEPDDLAQKQRLLASFTLHHSSCSLQHCLVAERCPVGPVFIVYKQERKLKSQSRTLLNSSESEDTDSGGEDGSIKWFLMKSCLNVTSTRECDLTVVFDDVNEHYATQVQAFNETQHSDWTSMSSTFKPLSDTVLGPPEVSVSGCGDCLSLQIKPPRGKGKKTLLTLYHQFDYSIGVQNMKDGRKFSEQLEKWKGTVNHSIKLLEPGTEYCVTVRMYRAGLNMNSKPCEPQCAFTSPEPVSKARIGPPSDVKLKSRSGFLDINISDPLMKIKDKTLHNTFDNILYLVSYWKNTSREEVKTIRSEQTFLVLENLEPWSTYCVQVQISVSFNNTGEPSRPVCEKSTSEGKTPGWMIAVILICSLVAVAAVILCLFFVGFYTYKTVHFFFPSCNLPEHYKELLTKTPNSYAFLDIQNNKELDEVFDEISIVLEQPASPIEAMKTEQESKENLEEQPLVEEKYDPEFRKDIPHYGNLN
ncbi:UNVERIFIED_CONTAM: hypothetical protein FKN15_047623 [Acipenser sinensis]